LDQIWLQIVEKDIPQTISEIEVLRIELCESIYIADLAVLNQTFVPIRGQIVVDRCSVFLCLQRNGDPDAKKVKRSLIYSMYPAT
jgi:hypothetical protein